MDVSLVIRTKNEAQSVRQTLNKLEEQEFSGQYEVIIVDSESTDSTLDIISGYDTRLVQIPQKEFTYGRSLNIGASYAKGTFIVNLSAHAFPRDEKWLSNLIEGFEDRNVAATYGKQFSDGRVNPFDALQNELFFGRQEIAFKLNNENILRKMHFTNSNSAIRKDIWNNFRFNEEVAYAEDMLWQAEVIKAGFSILYTPDAAVYHTHEVSICNAYKYSRDCSYTLALMRQKRQSIAMVLYDVGLVLGLAPRSLLQNVSYIWRNNYLEYLKIAPVYVLSGWLGWLVGRAKYRLSK